MKAFITLKDALQVLRKLTCLVSWLNEGLTYLQAPQEASRTLEGSLQIMNILEHPTQVYIQAYVQLYTRHFWNSLEYLRLFPCLPPQCTKKCGCLQPSLESSTLFPPMAKCRCPQKLPGLYISPWGGSLETSYDNKPTKLECCAYCNSLKICKAKISLISLLMRINDSISEFIS